MNKAAPLFKMIVVSSPIHVSVIMFHLRHHYVYLDSNSDRHLAVIDPHDIMQSYWEPESTYVL